MSNQVTVSNIFARALEIRSSNPNGDLKELRAQLVSEFSSGVFPSTAQLAIPEFDNVAPEEDWSAGLPVILRGIQTEDWNELAHGIVICLEQVENYPKESGREDDPRKEWRNRSKGIEEATDKTMTKWMPSDLMDLAKRSAKQ
jgi:hypothetical protein